MHIKRRKKDADQRLGPRFLNQRDPAVSWSEDQTGFERDRPARVPKKVGHEGGDQQERNGRPPISKHHRNNRQNHGHNYKWNSVTNHVGLEYRLQAAVVLILLRLKAELRNS